MSSWQQLDQGLWIKDYPLQLLGTSVGRRVTVFELSNLILVHSTGPFTEEDTQFLKRFAKEILFMEATCFHDSFTRNALETFPKAKIYVPSKFPLRHDNLRTLDELEPRVSPDIELILLQGLPKVNETVIYHRASETLVVADLVFNFQTPCSRWTRFFFRWIAGMREYPAMSRFFRMMIRDRDAFRQSMEKVLSLPFERLIMAHGEIVEKDGRQILQRLKP